MSGNAAIAICCFYAFRFSKPSDASCKLLHWNPIISHPFTSNYFWTFTMRVHNKNYAYIKQKHQWQLIFSTTTAAKVAPQVGSPLGQRRNSRGAHLKAVEPGHSWAAPSPPTPPTVTAPCRASRRYHPCKK